VSDEPRSRRFLTIAQAAEELNVNQNQIRALIRTGELRGIQVGGRACGASGPATSRTSSPRPTGARPSGLPPAISTTGLRPRFRIASPAHTVA
jgi:excisionase family DNA binding protein